MGMEKNPIDRRIDDLTAWLKENAPDVFVEQRHLQEGTPERAYWHHGYLMALRDVTSLKLRTN